MSRHLRAAFRADHRPHTRYRSPYRHRTIEAYELIRSGDVETVKIGTATLVKVASLRRLTERGAA